MQEKPLRARRSCSYVERPQWRFGDTDPFCGAPAEANSAYCARHHALCQLAVDSVAGREELRSLRRTAAGRRGPPAALKYLASVATPVRVIDDPVDWASVLDHRPRAPVPD